MSIKKYVFVGFAVVFVATALWGSNKDLPAPNNFTVFADTMKIGISWEAPDSSSNHLIRYDLHRSDLGKYFSFEEIPSEIYYDYMVEHEEYSYYVKAVYWEGESQPSEILSITPLYDFFYTGSVSAYVSDYYDNPIENARVVLDGDNGIVYSVLSDIGGVAYLDQLRLGSYDVYYYHPCYGSAGPAGTIIMDSPGWLLIFLDFGSSCITTTPNAIYYSIEVGTTDSVSLYINNISSNSFAWTASICNNSCPNKDWISLSDSTGVILGNDQIELQLYFDATQDRSSIIYTCDVAFRANYETTFAEVPVSLEVTGYSIDDESNNSRVVLATPNPFKNLTTIYCNKANNSMKEYCIMIFNLKGQLIRKFNNLFPSQDLTVSVNWDGEDYNGEKVTPGLYFYQVKAGDEIIGTNKCLLIGD